MLEAHWTIRPLASSLRIFELGKRVAHCPTERGGVAMPPSVLGHSGTASSEFFLQGPISAFIGTFRIGAKYEDVPFAEDLGCSTC